MLKKLGLILSTVLLAIAAFALSASPAAAESSTVKMGTDSYQLKFDPAELTVSPGDTVKFQNNKLAPHNIVFEQEPLASLGMTASKTLFSPTDSYSVTIPDDIAPGAYSFYCSPHRGAGMTGTLTVE
ncbi:plastocyanin [Spirulina sp. 06S082]|uniref:plastocyanin n=1 Tax=Spirulina sp. 06S082 TaxID=3110248 RepID=UPI002B2023E1|nr:plastocyanin [Spirulina sp. 06S082]MEA5472220.1 plastocyanin [Spirulina sp. 06S082]